MTRITETVYQDAAPKVDPTNGILYGVKLLGETSRNGRRYTPKAMREAAKLYEGLKSYVDHPDRDRLQEDRKFRDWSGVFRNARYVEGSGIFADQHLRRSSEYFEGIVEAAEKFPTHVGYSHVAEGDSRQEGETEIIESIREVFSADLVTDPATTNGFFESHRKHETINEAIELLPESPQKTILTEMMGDYSFGEMPAEGDKPKDPLSEFAAIAKELIRMLGEALIQKNTAPPPVPPPAETGTNPEAEAPEEEMTDEDKSKIANFESTQLELAKIKAEKMELRAKTLLLESNRTATPARVKALANCETEDDQAELLESWPQVEQSAGRPARSPGILEVESDFPRNNPEKFAALLR